MNTFEQKPFANLLDASFPGMKANMLRCEKLGFPWDSHPFFKEENGEIVSHVGFLDYPMLLEGRWYNMGALHAICTLKSHRGHGIASELINEALAWGKQHFDCVLLCTEIPGYYEKLSFQYLQEYRFHLAVHPSKGTQPLKPLITPQDNDLFIRSFSQRVPLSHRVWMKEHGILASFNTLFATYPTFWSLHYSPSIEGIISFEIRDKTLHLFDVIASKIPPLDHILAHFPSDIEEICFYFSPDRFTEDAQPEPYIYDRGSLMVHGEWPAVSPFMISPLSRC